MAGPPAVPRARKSLTLCEAVGGHHPFVCDLEGLVLRSRPEALPPEGEIVAVRVAAMLVRHAREDEQDQRC